MINVVSMSVKGKEGEKVALPKEVFEATTPKNLLAQSVRVYLANQRRSPARTKTRGMVSLTTAKMYKQKGTGKARHGSFAAPIFVGGGISHGPTGEQNYRLKMPKRMQRMALLAALSERAKSTSILVDGDKATGLTKELKWLPKKALLIVTNKQTMLTRGARNLTTIMTSENLNPYVIMAHKQLIISQEALVELEKYVVS